MRVQLWRCVRAALKAKVYTDADFPPWFRKNDDGVAGFAGVSLKPLERPLNR
jgi:hypothetical protein